MSIQGSSNIPHQPNWPSNHGQTLTNGGNSQLAKKILENNSTPSSSTIETKKVSKIDAYKKTENPDIFFSSKLPYFPQNSKPLQNIIEKVSTSRKHCLAEIDKNPHDVASRTLYVLHTLGLAKICHRTKQLEEEGKLIGSAKTEVDNLQLYKYFQSGSHFAKYLLDGYHGITCLDMNVIRDNLLTLRRAIALSNDPQKLITDLNQAAEFFEARWKELKDEGKVSEEDFKILSQQLEQTLTEDPFREEFIKNPELFKKVKDAPPILLQKYPHLASVDEFLSKYPDAGTITLPDNAYNSTNLDICIKLAKTSPLARLLILVSPDSMLTPVHARMLKDLLLEKQSLAIVFGNIDDADTLTDAFIKDSNLILDEKSLTGTPKHLDSFGEILFFKINPEYPVKKKPESRLRPSHVNTTLPIEEKLIPKTILENNFPSSSSPPKKVSKTDSHKKVGSPDIFFSSKIPYFPQNAKPSEYIITKVLTSKKRCMEEAKKSPHDIVPRSQLDLHSLALARIYHQKKQLEEEAKLIDSVKTDVDSFLLYQYFHTSTHFTKYLLDGYHGITCLDMNVIRDNLLTLRRAIALSNDPQKLITDLDKATEFFETRWKELKDEGKLSEEDFKIFGQQLKQILTEDPFKDEFIKNTELFKKVKDAPPALLKAYPHLASPDSFVSKYPLAGWIELPNQTFNTENLKRCINQAKTNPLASTLILDFVDPIITPSHASLLKDLLVEKQDLTLALGNKKDLTTIMMAFHDDIDLVFDKKTTFLTSIDALSNDRKIIPFRINPQSRIKKARALMFRRVDREDWTIRIRSNSGEVLSSIGYVLVYGREQPIDVVVKYDGKRILAVKKCDYEYALNLNRKYIDENGQLQEYSVAVLAEK